MKREKLSSLEGRVYFRFRTEVAEEHRYTLLGVARRTSAGFKIFLLFFLPQEEILNLLFAFPIPDAYAPKPRTNERTEGRTKTKERRGKSIGRAVVLCVGERVRKYLEAKK